MAPVWGLGFQHGRGGAWSQTVIRRPAQTIFLEKVEVKRSFRSHCHSTEAWQQ
jgi:hypothetical protein